MLLPSIAQYTMNPNVSFSNFHSNQHCSLQSAYLQLSLLGRIDNPCKHILSTFIRKPTTKLSLNIND
jgi:hypothetical protein